MVSRRARAAGRNLKAEYTARANQRRTQILKLAATGLTQRAIAQQLGISTGLVATRITQDLPDWARRRNKCCTCHTPVIDTPGKLLVA